MKKHSTDLKQVSGLLRWAITETDYATIADYGAGTGTLGPELADTAGKNLLRYDPHLPDAVNDQFHDEIETADVLICANVLNVLTDDQELDNAMRKICGYASRTRSKTAVVSIYRAPEPSKTQRAQPTSWYAERIRTMTAATVQTKQGKIWICAGQQKHH